jgi:hypothetical protein
MSKLNCPLLKSLAARHASNDSQTKKQILVAAIVGLAFGLGASLWMESNLIAGLVHKETELVAIHAIADAIHAEKATVASSSGTNAGSFAAL